MWRTAFKSFYFFHLLNTLFHIKLLENYRFDLDNSDVGYCLGYHPDEVLSVAKHHTSQNIAKLYLYHTCYIYIDIIQSQLVGDVKAPFLRVVSVKDAKLTYVHYDRPHFLSINRSSISVVEVNIREKRGNLLSFQSGTSIITLLFRRKPARFFSQ